MPEVWGSIGRSEEKLKFGAEKSDVPIEKSPEIGFKIGRMVKKIDGRTGKNVGEPSNNRPKLDLKRGKTRKKWTSQGKKRALSLEKSPENGLKTGKSGKNGDFGVKKEGRGSGEKMGFNADFAML